VSSRVILSTSTVVVLVPPSSSITSLPTEPDVSQPLIVVNDKKRIRAVAKKCPLFFVLLIVSRD
jgi:hypothetical protein